MWEIRHGETLLNWTYWRNKMQITMTCYKSLSEKISQCDKIEPKLIQDHHQLSLWCWAFWFWAQICAASNQCAVIQRERQWIYQKKKKKGSLKITKNFRRRNKHLRLDSSLYFSCFCQSPNGTKRSEFKIQDKKRKRPQGNVQ